MLSRFSSAAFSGTTTERNTRVSSRKDSTTTAESNTASRSLSRFPMSVQIAVWPPTCARAAVPARADGNTFERSRSIVAEVVSSCGAVVG
jgi:hypothetical protein